MQDKLGNAQKYLFLYCTIIIYYLLRYFVLHKLSNNCCGEVLNNGSEKEKFANIDHRKGNNMREIDRPA